MTAPSRAARDRRSLADFLRLEVTGGLLLLVAAAVALVLANSPWSEGYATVRDHHLAVPFLGLDLSIGHWASDGLLAVFFFVAGTELKRELTVGELRRPAAAALPVVAAVGGMVAPALIYLAVALAGGGSTDGWAVPMATDIAFALGVLAVVGRRLPGALRTFLLTLAIVDDLLAILVIAVFFTSELNVWALAGAVAGLVLYRLLHTRGVHGWYWYLPLAGAVWTLTYHSGVHATVAGVALGMLLRATPRDGEAQTPAERVGHLVHPLSAGVAVPLFALFAAGVSVSPAALGEMAGEPEAVGVVLGLFLGKLLGVLGATWLTVRLTRARLDPRLGWPDLAGGALLAGIGFTVALLIAELAFVGDPRLTEHVKAAVLLASLLAAASASVVLTLRGRALARRSAR
ncbi:Na+/H+ antiporter NhaA [Streptomyces sp. 3MP-14]|uniref:Na(+)/H(+) antiporter NhaA n=1 Tax=Streptomyces mimosae TaxID=2586635 RepID=A0A5N5ZY12_9ACTN|nr:MULTISPECIES: Na+/H+ antiporter NhaA [Streptomyces]KAB8161394.1 Na+/H+ antiporter NhaA [Streptomyces mimosae]KAB8173282.1 Na+/H+ antiporter NhaA [Streptomyces sp. 3MP-14]